MFLRHPWVPGLLTWQQLWLLVLVAPFPEKHWILLTTKPSEPREPWSLPDLLPELSNALTAQTQPEGFGKVASSDPSQGLAPPLKSPERIGLSQVQPEAHTGNQTTVKAQSSSSHQEAKDDLLQPPEEAKPSLTQQDTQDQYELGPEEGIDQLLIHQEPNAPSPHRNKAHRLDMLFVTVRPVDTELTKTAEAEKEPQPTSSQEQAPAQPAQSPEEVNLSSTQQEVLPQSAELSKEVKTSSTQHEPPAQPLRPLVRAKSSTTKHTETAQPSESSGAEESSASQSEGSVQPTQNTEELKTSPTKLKQPRKFKGHHKKRVSTPDHHHAKHPHLPLVTGKPPNLQFAISPEPTKEEGIFQTHPEGTVQPLAPVIDVESSISHQEDPDLLPEPSEGAELLPFQQEASAQSSEPDQEETTVGNSQTSEEDEPPLTPQEPSLSLAQPPELHEAAASPLGDDQVQPPALNSVTVTSAESSSEVEIASSPEQEPPAQFSVSPEQFEPLRDSEELITQQANPAIQDENSPLDSGLSTPPAELPRGHSTSQLGSSSPFPDFSANGAVSPSQQEFSDQSSETLMKFTASLFLTKSVTFSTQWSEPSEDTELSSVPQEGAAPSSEPPNKMEPSGAQEMTTPQPAELSEIEETSPAQQQAMATLLNPSEEGELSSTQPMLPSQLPNERTTHPPSHDEMTVSTPSGSSLTVTFNPSDLQVTFITEPSVEDELSTVMKKATSLPPKHHTRTLPPPTEAQAQHPELSLITVRPLRRKLDKTSQMSTTVRPSPTVQETLSQPPEPPKETDIQTAVPHKVKVLTPGLEPAHYPTSPRVTEQHLNLELTTPAPSIEAQYSVGLQKAVPSPEHPQVTLVHLKQTQAQHPDLDEVTVESLDVELTITEYSVSYSTGKTFGGQEKQKARTNTDICELCSCEDETLSCTGLSPKQKLQQVPVLEPNSSFTTINFQENSIFYLAENIWTTYKWAQKLNLSENDLTELHKNSFKGLLSLQYLDLSCNKIQFIEAQTFEPLPFLQFINLRCNLLTQLGFGTFRAWHGMQFLQKVILNHNPLATVEDSYLYKLPALRYLDLGTTHTPLPVVENILMMTLGLKTLIVPRHMACCLCQFKSSIEVVCKTVKLHCDNACETNATQCLEEAPIGNTEGAFMKVLQARKKNTKTELVIEPEKPSSEQSDANWSDFKDEEDDSNDESEVIGALNYILPYFSEEKLEDVNSLLPFIRLLFSKVHNDAHSQGDLTGNRQSPSHQQPGSTSSAYKNELKKLYFLRNWLNAEIQGKIEEVKKKEKTGKLMPSSLSSSEFQSIPKSLAGAQAQGNSLVEDQHRSRSLRTVDQLLKGPKGIRKRLLKERQKRAREKLSIQPPLEHTADEWSLSRPSTGKRGQKERVLRPRNSAKVKLFPIEQKAPVPSSLQGLEPGSSPISTSASELGGAKHWVKDLSSSILLLEHAGARVKSMKAAKPILASQESFSETHTLMPHRTPQPRPREPLAKKSVRQRLRSAERPLFWALRSLIHSPPQGLPSSSGDLSAPENGLSQLHAQAKSSGGGTAAGNQTEGNTPARNVPASPVYAPVSVVTALTLMSSDDHTNDMSLGYPSTSAPSPLNDLSFPSLPSPGDQFESQLNQQLHVLIPNKEVRKLISYVIRTLKMDCSEPRVQLACAKLISRTGLLMKLLSEQQEEKVAQTQWDTEQWKSETYINESAGEAGGQKGQRGSKGEERTQDVPGHGLNNKLIIVISVTVVVMLLIFILCLIEICYHRTASEQEGSSRGFFRRRKPTPDQSQEGFSWFWRTLLLRNLKRPATRQQTAARKEHDSSDEEVTTTRDTEELSEPMEEEALTKSTVSEPQPEPAPKEEPPPTEE
ncbi:PREDICTED: leucine-rich repeat-containing protein 37A3-like [Chinchilla lanigera]|uniref:leucine-rich repeat-containing protein 37A3-like n=1 Tax=Chinchilla lanigera TaxID=34839 RepID=UPI0006965CFD|nr:PREDICTED: leucine-rich repeat-containing protein 37A3-like [Chinchilla lanigera]